MNLPLPCNKRAGTRQGCTLKKPYVYVRSEYIDVAERRISQTCNRTAVMQKFPDFVPAFSHYLEPLTRDGSQFTSMLVHPRIDGGIPLDSSVESQQFRSHGGASTRTLAFHHKTSNRLLIGESNRKRKLKTWLRFG